MYVCTYLHSYSMRRVSESTDRWRLWIQILVQIRRRWITAWNCPRLARFADESFLFSVFLLLFGSRLVFMVGRRTDGRTWSWNKHNMTKLIQRFDNKSIPGGCSESRWGQLRARSVWPSFLSPRYKTHAGFIVYLVLLGTFRLLNRKRSYLRPKVSR